jgi:hypothetical protein
MKLKSFKNEVPAFFKMTVPSCLLIQMPDDETMLIVIVTKLVQDPSV